MNGEYFTYYKKYKHEFSGDKICVLMQIGSFYEMQMLKSKDETVGNVDEIARLINIQVTRKNKKIEEVSESNPIMAGFPLGALSKYLPVLLDNNYRVIVIDQVENTNSTNKIKRKVTGIYSNSLRPTNMDTYDENNLTILTLEYHVSNKKMQGYINYSIINFDNITDSLEIYDKNSLIEKNTQLHYILEDIYRILYKYNTRELVINIDTNSDIPIKELSKTELCKYLEIDYEQVHYNYYDKTDVSKIWKEYKKTEFQNEYLKSVYHNLNFGLLTPIEYFNLEKYPVSVTNLVFFLEFINKHDTNLIKNISIPELLDDSEGVLLDANTVKQLNILPDYTKESRIKNYMNYDSLFQILNKTNTVIGKRGLRKLLCNPFYKRDTINTRYFISERLSEYIPYFSEQLQQIYDIERLHKRMKRGKLTFGDLAMLYKSYTTIREIIEYIDKNSIFTSETNTDTNTELDCIVLSKVQLVLFEKYLQDIENTFDIKKLDFLSYRNEHEDLVNIFKRGKIQDLDNLFDYIKSCKTEIEKTKNDFEKKCECREDWLKLSFSETEGYYLTCTKSRYSAIIKNLDPSIQKKMTCKINTNICKIWLEELNHIWLQLQRASIQFKNLINRYFYEKIEYYETSYSDKLFKKLSEIVCILDICLSNVKCKIQYKYCLPEISVRSGDSNQDYSWLQATGIRHPIIERINENTEYIKNDISLGIEENKTTKRGNGIILYALNSCGKSSLLRSIGVNLLMAQCGLYVACDKFSYNPFKTIISQVDLQDDLFRSHSSFVKEMIGLKKILKIADKKTLVLSDELTKGTEGLSATSILSSSALKLVERGSKFIFTTHLHDVSKLPEIKNCKEIQICHLNVDINEDDEIIFRRKLKPGPSTELYGLEVARAVGIDKSVLNFAFKIRDKLLGLRQNILNNKTSKYNRKKLLDKCEICGYYPNSDTDIPLDTHHIKEQMNADNNNFTGHFHKNSKHNLVSLCKKCHESIHRGEINVTGYVITTSGKKLEYISQ